MCAFSQSQAVAGLAARSPPPRPGRPRPCFTFFEHLIPSVPLIIFVPLAQIIGELFGVPPLIFVPAFHVRTYGSIFVPLAQIIGELFGVPPLIFVPAFHVRKYGSLAGLG